LKPEKGFRTSWSNRSDQSIEKKRKVRRKSRRKTNKKNLTLKARGIGKENGEKEDK